MKQALGPAALSCALGLVSAKAVRWHDNEPRWVPAQETLGVMLALGEMHAPLTTPAPEPPKAREALERRDTEQNTCGYVSGSPSELSPLMGLTRTLD